MASVMTNIATSILIFISIIQGILSVVIEHKTVVNATVGENISLPCIINSEGAKMLQLVWGKKDDQGEHKFVLFNPDFSPIFYMKITLELVNKTNTTELRGSILHLHEVTEKDSGDYVCDIASFPGGNFRSFTKVQVTEPKVSMNMISSDSTVIEGDTVSITCDSDPSPDKYILFSQGQKVMESQDGKFTIQNVTRHISDLICQPFWSSSNQHLKSLKATLHLTVDFLDNIKCNSESQIQIEIGTNLTISCEAKSSKSLRFVWMKDNITVSTNASINLWSVSPDHAEIYTLIVQSENLSRLHRQKDFTVTVMHRPHTEHLSSTMAMETTPQISSTTITSSEPKVTTPTSQAQHFSSTTGPTLTEEVMYISTSAPSTGNVTMVHVNIITPHTAVRSSATTFTPTSSEARTLAEICCTSSAGFTSRETNHIHPDTSTVILTSASMSTVTISNILTTNITRKDVSSTTTKSRMAFIFPVLSVLLLIGFLYRQYLIKKRLDMPPPFKPPPPPVKYTSARYHDIPINDILV